MTIEIKITDVKNLTIEQINTLTEFLIKSSEATEIKSSEAGETKTRKRRTVKEVTNDILHVEENVPPPPTPEPPSLPTTPLTYEEVIAFVLENTRENRLEFDHVMAVVHKFEIPNINSLNNFPDLIMPVYLALKKYVRD